MEQRFRLVMGGQQSRTEKRISERQRLSIPGQIVWKDARGTTRMASVITRDVSDNGVAVDCISGTPIPQYRLVYFQIDRSERQRVELPQALRGSHVLSAVYRVEPCSAETGLPAGYALRLLVEPERAANVTSAPVRQRAARNTA
jgi:hypothetical protein